MTHLIIFPFDVIKITLRVPSAAKKLFPSRNNDPLLAFTKGNFLSKKFKVNENKYLGYFILII